MVNEVKVNKVQDITERLQDAKAIVLVDYKGINIEEVDKLRTKMRNAHIDYFVSKNPFIRRHSIPWVSPFWMRNSSDLPQ